MTTTDPFETPGEPLSEFLGRPEVTPEVYAALRALHRSGRSPDEMSHRIWNLVRTFHPVVSVGRLRDQISAASTFPPDTWADVKSGLLHLEAGIKEFGQHAAKRLILRPRRERLEAALRFAPAAPPILAARVQAALAASS